MQSLTTGSVTAAKPVSRIINPDLGFHLPGSFSNATPRAVCVCGGGRGCRCACQHVYVWVYICWTHVYAHVLHAYVSVLWVGGLRVTDAHMRAHKRVWVG